MRFTFGSSTVFLIGLWLLSRPYSGIRHDGILYVGQALLHLYPDIFSQDIFFAHGSQDNYSLFSSSYAWLIDRFGLAQSALMLAIIGQMAFVISVALLAHRLLNGRTFWIALFCLAIIPGYYGGLGIFSYAETFVTARTFAEPISLLGLYFLLRLYWLIGCLLLALAAVTHPLVALSSILLAWVRISMAQPRYWWLASGVLAIPFLALLKIPPFTLSLETFDPDWLRTIQSNSGHLLLQNWDLQDWNTLAYDFFILITVRRLGPTSLRDTASSLLVAGFGALVISGIFCDLIGNVLAASLQLWRILWLIHLSAVIFTPWVYLRLLEATTRSTALVIIFLLYLALLGNRYLGASMSLALAAVLLARTEQIVLSPWVRWFVTIGVVASISAVTFKDLKANSYIFGKADTGRDILGLIIQGISRPAILTGFITLYVCYLKSRRNCASSSLACLLLLIGYYGYDQRSLWARFVENGLRLKHPFEEKLSPRSQIYWQGDVYGLLGTWVLLKHTSYLTSAQGAGVTFDREMATQFRRREEAFEPLILQESICAAMNSIQNEHCSVNIDALREVCSLSDAPDFLIIESKVPPFFEAEWTFEADGFKGNTFYLYRCDTFRESESSSQ